MKLLFAVLLMALFVSGCATTPTVTIPSWQARKSNYPSIGRIGALAPMNSVRESDRSDLIAQRNAHLGDLRKARNDLQALLDSTGKALRKEAEGNSQRTLTLAGIGIGASIATAALAPGGNLVYVAALAATSSGALAFQTKAALEGMSRAAVARVYNNLVTKIDTADALFEQAMAEMASHVHDYSEVQWGAAAEKAQSSLSQIRNAATFIEIPGPTDEAGKLEALRQEFEEYKRQHSGEN